MIAFPDAVRAVAATVAASLPPAEAEVVARAVARLDEPLRVAIAGRVKAGKSTLLNALVGRALAATDAAECTRCVTWYLDGPGYGATLVDHGGRRVEVGLHLDDDQASVDLRGHDIDDVARLEVTYPSQHLRDLTLIDTPGVASISEQVSARATSFLAPPDGERGADVVVYLLRHLHQSDRDSLEAFTDASAASDPVRCVGVLARADELGAGRGDSMALARAVADRYARSGEIGRRVSDVLPVSGLLAFTAATLRQDEYDRLASLAAMPVELTDRLTVSADRFAAESASCPVPSDARSALLERFGLFGLRFCLAVIRSGRARSVDALEAELCDVSGIQPLRSLLLDRFAARADVLKAAGALDLVRAVAHRHPVPPEVVRELGRVEANAHELEELRCLRLVQEGITDLPDELRVVVVAALGGDGPDQRRRLGLPADALVDGASSAQRARELVATLRRVRARPLLASETARALDGAIRSLERVHATVAASLPSPR